MFNANLALVKLKGVTDDLRRARDLRTQHVPEPDYPPTGMWALEQCVYAIAVAAMALAYASGFALLWMRKQNSMLQVLAIAIFAAQCVVSSLWLQHFRFGPLEWIWRRATYGTPVANIRRREVSAA